MNAFCCLLSSETLFRPADDVRFAADEDLVPRPADVFFVFLPAKSLPPDIPSAPRNPAREHNYRTLHNNIKFGRNAMIPTEYVFVSRSLRAERLQSPSTFRMALGVR